MSRVYTSNDYFPFMQLTMIKRFKLFLHSDNLIFRLSFPSRCSLSLNFMKRQMLNDKYLS